VKILEKGLDVHQKLASVDIRPLHQLMEDMFSKMVDSVKIMVRCCTFSPLLTTQSFGKLCSHVFAQ